MQCKKCGKEIESELEYCDDCRETHQEVQQEKIIVTYDDQQVEVDAPVIIESHTFIDEDGNLKEKINEKSKSIKENNKKLMQQKKKEKEEIIQQKKKEKEELIQQKKTEKEKISQKNQEEKQENNNAQEKVIVENNSSVKSKTNKVMITIVILLVVFASIAAIYIINNSNNSKKLSGAATNIKYVWEDNTITLDGVEYKLNDNYNKFQKNGWLIDENTVGDDYVIIDAHEKTKETIKIINEIYHESEIIVGLANISNSQKEITECNAYSIKLNNYEKENKIPFVLPGNIKNGAAKETIFKIYGSPLDKNVIKSKEKGLTTYRYVKKNKMELELYVFDDEGLQGFKYKKY